ncbi:copper amine oxidase N-terminal domain-containing protein [Paenibacillaceae bacterium]|nr:copper amine oxidase N-terminal domain-containing protein [Paenibacillaceae bacterium]
MRKRIIASSVAMLLLLSSASASVSAHPGRTDSSGGHTCRTNCAKWGLEQGEYHYHNGSKSSSSKSGSGQSSSSSKSSGKSSSKSSSSSSTSSKSPAKSAPAYVKSGLAVYVNDSKVSFKNVPLSYENTNLVPLRELAKALGATVAWDENSGKIEVKKGKRTMTLKIGSKQVAYNGSTETASAAPKVIQGVTYVPIQVFARGLGAGISYSEKNNTLKLTI